MEQSYTEFNRHKKQLTAAYEKASPDVMAGFRKLQQAALKEGALDVKQKELIALGIAIAVRCDGCIGAHVAGAIQHGATKQELVETIDIALLMGGGPSIVYGSEAYAAVEELIGE
ncbi:carboxymuconolactone decarboxylase family protein [Vibrio tritonius]|uniref:Carboxymuconolactone decarboxylase family protein n=1 Tax=Vibrio tritonius TaxID=1435069 RepID=A0ABS7YJI7_9VIBR|nr:carboxymuconolactone decarboxylase family protein [Vibrio tritonius]MCA2015851.1 carboxymuconolactone decarboxylase family protein [Vibrio tritonius]